MANGMLVKYAQIFYTTAKALCNVYQSLIKHIARCLLNPVATWEVETGDAAKVAISNIESLFAKNEERVC